MSSYYERLQHAIARHRTDNVRELLTEMSLEDKTCLLMKEESLLDVAASKSQSEVMALLIENGVTKWFGSKDNNRVFIRLIDDYKADKIFGNLLQNATCRNKSSLKTDKEPTTLRHKCRMDVLKHREDSADTTAAIKVLLAFQERWLVSQLRRTALVRNTSKIVGDNISWFIQNGVLGAYDRVTGRKLRMNQVLFQKPVELLLCGESDDEPKEWTVNIKGTTEQVLQKIYSEYEPIFEEMGDGLFSEGLCKMREGKYFLALES